MSTTLPDGWKEAPNVTVGGVEYPTVIDPNGTQRFVADPLLSAACDCGALCLNKLGIAYNTGKSGLTQRQYAELNIRLGYSIGGFSDLSSFFGMAIENPLWGAELNESMRDRE